MKKIYSLIGTLSIAFAVNAQNAARPTNTTLQFVGKPQITGSQLANAVTTTTNVLLVPASFDDAACQSEIGFYTSGTYGNTAGTNTAGDNYMAQKYSLTTYSLNMPATVLGVQAIMEATGTGTISAEIYSDNAGTPGTLLGTSGACDISTINTNSNTAVFIFSTPVALTGTDFYVAINFVDLAAAGTGTINIAQTNTCTTNTSGAWEQFNDNSWNAYADPNNWDWTTDLGIFPYVSADFSTGIKSLSASVISLYPNPTTGVLNVNATEANSSLEVYNIIGSKVFSSALVKGNNSIDLSGLSNGSYFVKMNSNNQVITKKVVISK
ncbi:MAG: T9SS type A sorting domain-containing protein [Bacteroidetes bacterium]|nr:T9SS type A sorting domain-containing protein [Bacteroidota bacterium]